MGGANYNINKKTCVSSDRPPKTSIAVRCKITGPFFRY